jgi:ABC-type lipoprotein export system ATPase subunit
VTLPPPIAAHGLVRHFDSGAITVLAGVDFVPRRGEITAVTGASGSGKTTLLNLLGLLDRPDAGSIHIDGLDVARADEPTLRRVRATRLGFVFQDALLDMRRTAFENVMLGLRFAATRRRDRAALAYRALEMTGTAQRAGARGATLSGGERQRVAIARAIAHRPAALLCDEPTGALDEGNTQRVFDLLVDLASTAATTVILVTHDTELAQRCHDWATLSSGTLSWRASAFEPSR